MTHKIACRIIFFGLMVLYTWHLAKFVPWQYWNYINFHNSISWFRSFNACLLYILRAGPRPTKGKIRSNCKIVLHCHKEIQSPCRKLKIQKCHKFNWETPSCTIEHIFFKKLLVRETTKHFPIFLPLVNETLFKAYLTPQNGQENMVSS